MKFVNQYVSLDIRVARWQSAMRNGSERGRLSSSSGLEFRSVAVVSLFPFCSVSKASKFQSRISICTVVVGGLQDLQHVCTWSIRFVDTDACAIFSVAVATVANVCRIWGPFEERESCSRAIPSRLSK